MSTRSQFNYCGSCSNLMSTFKDIDGMERRKCSSCGWIFYDNPVPVVAAIVERKAAGEIVLVRGVGWPEKWFGLVTGFLEAQENPSDAVVREVKEELGIDVAIQSLVGVYSFHRMNQVIVCYHVVVRDETTEVKLQETELSAYKFVKLEDIKPWKHGTGQALRDWLKTRFESRL